MYTTGTRSKEVSNKKQRSRQHELEGGNTGHNYKVSLDC